MLARLNLTSSRLLLVIFGAALALRVAAVLLVPMPDIVSSTESGVTALNLVQGRGYIFDFYGMRPDNPLQSFMPPLFTYLLAFCLRFFNHPALAFGLIQAVLASLTVMLIYFIAVQLSSDRVAGYASAIGVAFYPVYIVMCAYPFSMILTTFLVALFVLIAVQLQQQWTLRLAALAGVVLGLAVLVRPMLLGLLPLLLIALWLNQPGTKTYVFKVGLVSVAATLLMLVPWTIRNYLAQGQVIFVSTNGGFTFWVGNNPFTTGSGFEVHAAQLDQFLGVPHDPRQSELIVDLRPYALPQEVQRQVSTLDEITLDQMLYRAGFQFIQTEPARWWPLLLEKIKGFLWFRSNIGSFYTEAWTRYYQILYAALIGLAVPGLALTLRQWRKYALLYLMMSFYALTYIMFHVQTRFRWEIELYLIMFAALTVSGLYHRIRLHGRQMDA